MSELFRAFMLLGEVMAVKSFFVFANPAPDLLRSRLAAEIAMMTILVLTPLIGGFF